MWTAAAIPDLSGRTAVVTGANAGLGWQIALELARHGAQTVLACRNPDRAAKAVDRIRAAVPDAPVQTESLDLADLASVRAFADRFLAGHAGLDLLVNNAAGVMLPRREVTVDGFERQFGTNHLGHFALTGLLLPALLAIPGARVVTMSSVEVHWARLDLDDLHSETGYGADRAYAQSKFANLLFTMELHRRFGDSGLLSLAAHPGWAATDQQQSKVVGTLTRWFAQSAAQGALPALYAATMPGITGASYVGPDGWLGMHGYPRVIQVPKKARNANLARALWQESERLTGVTGHA